MSLIDDLKYKKGIDSPIASQTDYLDLEEQVRWQNFVLACILFEGEDLKHLAYIAYKGDIPTN